MFKNKNISDLRKIAVSLRFIFIIALIIAIAIFGYNHFLRLKHENAILKKVISRLEADSRAAEILVTGVNFDEEKKKALTTIKFLEYDVDGLALKPRYFTFSGNIIQFQSLVIRFDDELIRKGDGLRGRSAYIFWKVFLLDGKNTQEYEINKLNDIPQGYKIRETDDPFEKQLWENFWAYALNPEKSRKSGIKNAQIEAPGTMFVPGHLYIIKIEHDGGLRIDTERIPAILRGENIPDA